MDKQIQNLIKKEEQRQSKMVHLIPSENFVSKEILAALGSCLTNKYADILSLPFLLQHLSDISNITEARY